MYAGGGIKEVTIDDLRSMYPANVSRVLFGRAMHGFSPYLTEAIPIQAVWELGVATSSQAGAQDALVFVRIWHKADGERRFPACQLGVEHKRLFARVSNPRSACLALPQDARPSHYKRLE
jgi:hypothetical protein